jgi:hypothetical protein
MAEAPIAFAGECCRLYQDASLWERLRTNALLRVINELSDEVFAKAVASVIINVHPNRQPSPVPAIRSGECP